QKASELDTKMRSDAFYRLGFVYLRIGKPDETAKIWEKGSKNAKTFKKWFDCIDDLAKLHRNETIEHVLTNLANDFPDSVRLLKKMLNFGVGDSAKIIGQIFKLDPYDKIFDNYARTYFSGKSFGDILEIARKSSGLEKGLMGHFLIDNSVDIDTVKYGISALNGFADTYREKIRFAEYLDENNLHKYAYKVVVAAYSMAENKRDKLRARLFALDLLSEMNGIGIDSPLPKLFGGDEPDLLGGALSVLVDKNDVQNFVYALQSAENNFRAHYQCEKLLKRLVAENSSDTLMILAYKTLVKIARMHSDYQTEIKYLRAELASTKKFDKQVKIYYRMMDIYNSQKSYSKTIDIADELFARFASNPDFENKISDIKWKIGRTGKNSTKNFIRKYFHKWLGEIDNGNVAIENFLAISKIYYSSLSKSEKWEFYKQYLRKILDLAPADEFWSYIALNNVKSFDELEAFYSKYPFIPQYLKKLSDVIVLSKNFPQWVEYSMDSAMSDSEDIALNLYAAELQYRASHFERAYPLYKRVLSVKPGWRFLLVRVGELAHSLDDTAIAIDCYKKLITLEPHNQQYAERLGDILEQWHKNAEPVWNLLTYNNPLESDSWSELAAVQWDYLRYDNGVQTIYDARKFFGNDKMFAKELGALFDWQGKYDDAFKEYIHALQSADVYNTDEIANWLERLFKHSGKPEKLLPELGEYVDTKLESPAVLRVFADLSFESGDTTSVVKKLSELASNSKSPDVLDEVIHYADMLKRSDIVVDANIRKFKIDGSYYPMVNSAYILADNGNLTRAIDIFGEVVSKNNRYRYRFAEFLMKYKKYSDASNIYKQTIADDSLDCDNYIGLNEAYLKMNKFKKSRKMLTDAVEMFKNIDATKYKYPIKRLRIALAKTYRDGEPNEALAAYERLLNKYPLDENILRNIWLFAREKKLVPKLIKYYEDVASKAPKNYRWDILLWRLNRWQHKMNSAKKWLAQSCDNEPQRSNIWQLRYNVAFITQDFGDARKSLA
ncbi:hypothetical protein DRQ29_00930, partial [bacterium]